MTRTPAHPVRVIAVAGVLVAVLLAVALASMLWNDRNTRLQAAQRQSIAMASGSDRLLRAQLITMERALRGTANDGRELFARVPEQAPALFEASIRGVLERNHDLVSITLVDGRGRPLSSGRGDPTLPEWVTTQNRVLSGELYVGALEQLPGGHWTVRTALPVQPDQWLLARVRLGTFQEVVSGLDLGRDGVASIGNRYGQLLAHSRDPGRLVGRTLPTPMVMVPPSTEVIPGGVVTSPSDGQLRIAAISVPPDYPLILYTALSYQEVMARWYVFLYAAIGIYLIYLLGLAFLLYAVDRSARHQARLAEELRAGNAELALAYEVGKVGTWSVQGLPPRLVWSELTRQMLGLKGNSASPEQLLALVHEDDRASLKDKLESAQAGRGALNAVYRLKLPDGSWRWLSARGELVGTEGSARRLAGVVVDVSERVQMEERAQEAQRQFRLVFDRNPAPFWIFDLVTLRFIEVNQAAVAQYGYSRDEFLAMSILDIRPPEEWAEVRQSVARALRGEQEGINISTHLRKDGTAFQVQSHFANLEFAGRNASLVLAEDVSQRLRYESELAYRASHHAGTGLLTVRALAEKLDAGDNGYTIAHVQLRGLQMITDTLGREAGEDVLRAVAVRLGGLAARYGMLAHQPAEDFVLAIQGSADVQLVLDTLLAAVAEPVRGRDTLHQLEARVGVASCPTDGELAEQVLGRAAQAAHAARESGATLLRFEPGMAAHYTERLQLAGRIHMAIDHGEFELHFQPIRHAADGSPAALEALLRWPQADGSYIAPTDFIQLCEDTGLIISLGRWVIHAAARAQRQLVSAGWGQLPIAVNVSAVQLFNSDLVGDFSRAMQEFSLQPGALQMELTESVLMRNPTQALQTLGYLHANGIGVALDDFGTGFSSMSYLQHLPLDSLKIDRVFVKDVETNPRNAAICRALLSLGHSMGLSVIAEGVETDGQHRWLAAHGCDQVQGYLLGRPMPLQEVLTVLDRSRRSE